jgi:hypothetical protein
MFVSRRVAAALITVALGAGIIGCGSNDGDDTSPAAGTGGGPSMGEPLVIFFPKLNSAYIPGSDRKFKVPAVVQGVRADKWTCSDPNALDFEIDGVMNGVMITTKKAGDFMITATAGKRTGTVPIHVTAATEDDYTRGEARYNNAIQLMFTPGMFMGAQGGMVTFGMNNVSCKNCHGSGANFLAVEHTPQQTGGYTDDEIKNIFENGMKPPGAKWGSLPGIMNFYPQFHKWAASDEEYQGLVVYLRSMEPKSQGMLDFQGLINMFRMGMMGQMTSATGTAGSAAMGTAGAAP